MPSPPPTSRDPEPALHLTLAQMAPRPRASTANAERIAALAAEGRAGLLVTPELSLTGYDVGDSVHRLGVRAEPGDTVAGLANVRGQVVVGLIEAAPGGPFNSGVVLQDGVVAFRHRKIYLPTYGMFDEARWFGRGSRLDTWQPAPGWRAGLLICEDFWHPGLVYVLAVSGIDLLIVQAAAPGRGVWQGGAAGAFGSADVWERMARTAAQLYGIYVALVNRTGVEGGITFAGGSLIAGPDGSVLERADDHSDMTVAVELRRTVLQRCRQPYAHARDDDAALVLRELRRAMERHDGAA